MYEIPPIGTTLREFPERFNWGGKTYSVMWVVPSHRLESGVKNKQVFL